MRFAQPLCAALCTPLQRFFADVRLNPGFPTGFYQIKDSIVLMLIGAEK